MKSFTKNIGLLLLGIIILSSCSKPKYTASFAPSKQVRHAKVETPVITKSDVVKTEVLVSSETKLVAPVTEKIVKKDITLNKESVLTQSSFSKGEIKQLKKDVRKTVFKQMKNNLFKKITAVATTKL